jgi:hypothetical protein
VSASSAEQLAILTKHYGIDNREDVLIVKKLFKELNLEKKFQDVCWKRQRDREITEREREKAMVIFKVVNFLSQYEEESYQHLKGLIEATTHVPRIVYTSLLGQIYKRKV